MREKDDIIIFEGEQDITAGFTKKPVLSDDRRARLVECARKHGGLVVRPRLVHGSRVEAIDEARLDAFSKISSFSEDGHYVEVPETDGLVTDVPGVILTTTHGDCIPIYAYDPVKKVVGLAHAGWRGTCLGVAGKTVSVMKNHFGCEAQDIKVFIGPSICQDCFEVNVDVLDSFILNVPWSVNDYIETGLNGKYNIDLKGINARWCEIEGVSDIEISPLCSCCEKDMFWSYRRSFDSERMLAYIAINK